MYFAFDVGGTRARVATFDSVKEPKLRQKREWKTENKYEADKEKIITTTLELAGREKIEGVGLGLAGIMTGNKEELFNSPYLSDWRGKPLKKELEKRLGTRVVLENDAAAAALAEARYGNGKGRDFLFLIWGTGFGGTAVTSRGGKIELWPFEPGHQVVDWQGPRHGCGQRGCLEMYCAGAGIEDRYHKEAKDLAESEWEKVVTDLAHGLVNILTIRPSRLIIFGGGIAVKQAGRLARVKLIIEENLKVVPPPGEIRLTKFGEEAGLYGALALLAEIKDEVAGSRRCRD